MGRRDREHKQAVMEGREQPFRQPETKPALYLRCGKCGTAIPAYAATEHLLKCQPGGAKCGKCGDLIPAVDFMEHFKGCNGSKTAMPFPPPPPGPLSGGKQPIGIEPSGKLIFEKSEEVKP